MADTINELLIDLQELMEKLEAIGFGDDSLLVTHNGISRPSLQKAITDKFLAIEAMVRGQQAYETKALMDADLGHDADVLATVWNDTAENNGLYGKIGVSGSGSWVQSNYDLAKQAYLLSLENAKGSISSKRAAPFFKSIIDINTVPQHQRGDLLGDNGPVSTSISGWRSPFVHNGEMFDSLLMKFKDDGSKSEVKVTIYDATLTIILSEGWLNVESGVEYVNQVVVLNNYVDKPAGTVLYIEYKRVDDAPEINQASGSQYSASDPKPTDGIYLEFYKQAGSAYWSDVSIAGSHCISFRAFDSTVLIGDTNVLRSLEVLQSKSSPSYDEWASNGSTIYGGDPADDIATTTYGINGVGGRVTGQSSVLLFNNITLWAKVSVASSEAILRVYSVPSGTAAHIPDSVGTTLAEVSVSLTGTMQQIVVDLGSVVSKPYGEELRWAISPTTPARVHCPRWLTQGGGGVYPLEALTFSTDVSHGVGRFAATWYDGEQDYLTVPPILSIKIPGAPSNIPESRILALEAGKVDRFTPRVTLPEVVVAVVGKELNLYYDGFVLGAVSGSSAESSQISVEFNCDKGSSFDRQYRLTPVLADVGDHSAAVTVYDGFSRVIASKTITISVVAEDQPVVGKTICMVGDSLNTSGKLTKPVYDNFVALGGIVPTFVGSQHVDPWRNESRGGWTYESFATAGSDSYRLEVSGVTSIGLGAVYSSNGSEFTIREVNVTGGTGNVMCTSSNGAPAGSGTLTQISGTGDLSIAFSSAELESSNPFWNKITAQLDVANYRANIGLTALIDVATFQLGVNESFSTSFKSLAQVLTVIGHAKSIVDAFLLDNPECKILIGLPSTCGNSKDGWASNYGANYGKSTYENNIYLLREQLLIAFDAAAYNANVFIMSSGVVVDRQYGYERSTVPVAARIQGTISIHNNAVHPSQEGTNQIGDAVFGDILKRY